MQIGGNRPRWQEVHLMWTLDFFLPFFFLEQKETPASRTHSLSGGGRPFFGGGAYLEWHLRRRGNSSGGVFGTSGCFWQKGNSEAFFCMTQTNKQTTAVTHSLPVCLWDGQLSGLRCPWRLRQVSRCDVRWSLLFHFKRGIFMLEH